MHVFLDDARGRVHLKIYGVAAWANPRQVKKLLLYKQACSGEKANGRAVSIKPCAAKGAAKEVPAQHAVRGKEPQYTWHALVFGAVKNGAPKLS